MWYVISRVSAKSFTLTMFPTQHARRYIVKGKIFGPTLEFF